MLCSAAWTHTFTAASVRPSWSRSGAATERTPTASSWSTIAQPCLRTSAISASSARRPGGAAAGRSPRGAAVSAASRSAGDRAASSTRPIDVVAAGSRVPTLTAIVMIFGTATRPT